MSQTPLRKQDRATEPNQPRRLPTQFRNAVVCCLRSLDRRYTSFKEALSGFGESQSPSGALLQTYTKPFFQCGNTPSKSAPITRAAAENPPYWTTEAKKYMSFRSSTPYCCLYAPILCKWALPCHCTSTPENARHRGQDRNGAWLPWAEIGRIRRQTVNMDG